MPNLGLQPSDPGDAAPLVPLSAEALIQRQRSPSSPTTITYSGESHIDTFNMPSPGTPNSFVVTLSDQSTFGSNNAENISRKLGIPSNQVPSFCTMDPLGTVHASEGSYAFGSTGTQTKVKARYKGTFQGLDLAVEARCTAQEPLPPYAGSLFKAGDRFVIPLNHVTCPLPNHPFTNVTIFYDGTLASHCAFE